MFTASQIHIEKNKVRNKLYFINQIKKSKVKSTFKFEKPQVSKVLNGFNLVVFSTDML